MQLEISLPAPHPDQWTAHRLNGRFKAVRCGRRWGKTTWGEMLACDAAIDGKTVGYFTPAYKFQTEVYSDIARFLAPAISASSKMEQVIRVATGGRVDFWTLEDERAGRSRHYDLAIIDEAAFGPAHTMDAWKKSIAPTLLDSQGSAVVLSNTKGVDEDNFFWRICNEPEHGFVQHHAPTYANPLIPARLPGQSYEEWQAARAAEFERIKRENHPLVYQQEYLAEFVDWRGTAFFSIDAMLLQGNPLPFPKTCGNVFAVIDTAAKTGKDHDGTAVIYCAYDDLRHREAMRSRSAPADRTEAEIPLHWLDWDYVQIEGALLETWLPGVFARLEQLARQCGARRGSDGVYIEDKSAGEVLLQQARLRNWPAHPIESRLTALGKDERAQNAGNYVYQNLAKFTDLAFNKTVQFKDVSRNHLLSQLTAFRIGDKDAARRADDLLDCATYSIEIALGSAAWK